jgi:low-affinity ferrous iron transport protein
MSLRPCSSSYPDSPHSDGYTAKAKGSRLDRWRDTVVKFSGSEFVFLSIMAALLTWALMGIKFGNSENWQVVISDVQAIFTYVFDSFLMRQ